MSKMQPYFIVTAGGVDLQQKPTLLEAKVIFGQKPAATDIFKVTDGDRQKVHMTVKERSRLKDQHGSN